MPSTIPLSAKADCPTPSKWCQPELAEQTVQVAIQFLKRFSSSFSARPGLECSFTDKPENKGLVLCTVHQTPPLGEFCFSFWLSVRYNIYSIYRIGRRNRRSQASERSCIINRSDTHTPWTFGSACLIPSTFLRVARNYPSSRNATGWIPGWSPLESGVQSVCFSSPHDIARASLSVIARRAYVNVKDGDTSSPLIKSKRR